METNTFLAGGGGVAVTARVLKKGIDWLLRSEGTGIRVTGYSSSGLHQIPSADEQVEGLGTNRRLAGTQVALVGRWAGRKVGWLRECGGAGGGFVLLQRPGHSLAVVSMVR
jgi:hypothetical protein